MDWIIWLVVIVAIVAVVWWRLNRNSSRGTSGTGTGTGGTGTAGASDTENSAPPHVHDASQEAGHRGGLSGGGAAASASAAAMTGMPSAAGFGRAEPEAEPEAAPEWETQWSETPTAEPHAAPHQEPGHGGAHGAHVKESPLTGAGPAATGAPVHHPEYTEPHAPTLPGAESAAAESEPEAEAEGVAAAGPGFGTKTADGPTAAPSAPPSQDSLPPQEALPFQEPLRPQAPANSSLTGVEARQATFSSAASETAAGQPAEPAGHLAVDQPYGEGSAAPAADGSGPEGFTVKGDASSMIYHDETSPAYEETIAEVWFLSPAHAEAAGFRPPRRSRQ